MKKIGIKIFLLTKDFLNILIHNLLIFMTTKMPGTMFFVLGQTLILGFLTGMKKFKKPFQTGFRNGGFLWELLQIFFVLKLVKVMNISNQIVKSFSLLEIVIHYFFCSQLRILWILCWDFCTHRSYPSPFPQYLAREFKIKWWAAFKISEAQTFDAVKKWTKAQKPKLKKPTTSKPKVPIWSQPLPSPITKNSFPSNSAYRAYLKQIQAEAIETLSKLADSNSDDEDTASSTAFLQQNEDMCYGLPFTPLE